MHDFYLFSPSFTEGEDVLNLIEAWEQEQDLPTIEQIEEQAQQNVNALPSDDGKWHFDGSEAQFEDDEIPD